MLVSVIIPAYNAEGTIIRLLDSIMRIQNLECEAIVVDDGSKDNTGEVVEEYCKTHKTCKVVKKQNEGAPKARNAGLEMASGKWICFMDADDLIGDGEAFREALVQAEFSNSDVLVSDLITETETGSIYYKAIPTRYKLLKEKERFFFCNPIPGTKIFNRRFLIDNNIVFDDVKIGQDLNLYIKAIAVSENISYFPKAYYTYCYYSSGISRTYKISTLLDIRSSIRGIEEYCVTKGVYRSNKKMLEYIKAGNYTWQLKKKAHLSKRDFNYLRKSLLKEVRLIKHFDIRLIIAKLPGIIEFLFVKHFGIILRGI